MQIVDWMRLVLFLALIPVMSAWAATIEIVNENTPGTGFSDNAPAVTAAGDNGAETLGEQRLRVLQHAADIWGAVLHSNVPIRVAARMIDQPCGSDGTVLASAGPVSLAIDFPNAPRANTAYHIAQANALAGADLAPESNDIAINFNLALDAGCSGSSVGWWYGIDPDSPVPVNRTAMLPVALHELAHGLGFSAVIDLSTGEYASSVPTIWANYLYDLEAMKHWRSMTAAERVVSAQNDPNLVWSGSTTNRYASNFLAPAPALKFTTARGGFKDVTELGFAEFGARYPDAPLSGRVILINDGVAATDDPPGTLHDGCESPFLNGQRLAGRIALIDRGLCPFVDKARHAQQHGAVAVIIINNVEGPPPGMAGADPTITIPVVSVSLEIGRWLKRRLLRPQVTVIFGQTDDLAGVTQSCLRMYAPADLQLGSSVSHFHRVAVPDLLMEPAITRGVFDDLDLTPLLLRDIGWLTNLDMGTSPPNECIVEPLP